MARGARKAAGTLPRSFFARDADLVARDLLGRHLVHETEGADGDADGERSRLVCRIVETEAYFGPAGRNPHLAERVDMPTRLRQHLLRHGDPASHSYVGITDRNRVMYGPPGFWYVYLIYGMHECVNVVTGPEDPVEPQAVLLRAGEPVEGLGEMIARRGLSPHARPVRPTDVASGPGKLAKAMGISRADYGADACSPRARIYVEEGDRPASPTRIDATPRIGVVGAEHLRLRYVERGSPYASRAPATKACGAGAANARRSSGATGSSRL